MSSNNKDNYDEGVDLLDLMIILAAQKWFIIKTIFLFMFFGVGYALLATPIFKSEMQIIPPLASGAPSGAFAALSGAGLGDFAGMLGVKTPGDLVVGVVKSTIVLDSVIDKNDLMNREQEVGWLSQAVSSVRGVFSSAISAVVALFEEKSRDAQEVGALRVDVRTAFAGTVEITSDKLSGIINLSVKDTSPDVAVQLVNSIYEETCAVLKNVAITPSGQQKLFLEEQLKESERDLSAAEQKLLAYQKDTGIMEGAGGSRTADGLADLQARLIAKEIELNTARRFATAANPQVKKLEAEYSAIRAQFEQDAAKVGTSPISGVGLGGLPEAALEYAGLMREYKYREALWQGMLKQYETLRLSELNEPTLIQLLSPASFPEKKDSPRRTLIVALAGFLGVAFAFMGAFVRHFWSNTTESPAMAEKKALFKRLWRGKK